jgi:TPR repeat protein
MNKSLALAAVILSLVATTGCASTQAPVQSLEQYQTCIENVIRDTPNSPLVEEASKRFRAACKAGDPAGCSMQATIQYRRARNDKELRSALALFKKACRSGNVAACANAANISDRLEPGDKDALFGILAFACSSDNRSVCRDLADKVAIHGLPQHPLQVKRALGTACNKMLVGRACMQLAKIADANIKEASDIRVAKLSYLRACAMGEKSGCTRARELSRMARKIQSPQKPPAIAAIASRGTASNAH